MTERIYYTDPTVLEFEASVVDCGQHESRYYTVLDRSAFYPTSGGQPHDTGELNGVEVVDVIENDSGDVWHISNQPIGTTGDKVAGRVDGQRRRLRRQQHTAQHILSQSFVKLFGCETVSVHLGDEYGAVELDAKEISPQQLEKAEAEANRIIAEALPIEIMMVDAADVDSLPLRKVPQRSGTIRVIRMGEYDYSACGGTHCGSTAEVGLIKITGVEKLRGRMLVKFLAGVQAVDDYRGRFEVSDRLAQKLTCHYVDLPDKFAKLDDQNKLLRKELGRLQKEILPAQAKKLAESAEEAGKTKLVYEDVGEYDNRLAGQLASETARLIGGVAILILGGRLVIASDESSSVDASVLAKRFSQETGLKGGGSARQAQLGGASAEKSAEYRDVFRRLLSDG